MKSFFIGFCFLVFAVPAVSQDKVRAAVGQRGNWDTLFISQGMDAGILARCVVGLVSPVVQPASDVVEIGPEAAAACNRPGGR